ncbi:MAG TPA: hypothetical protein DC064_29530 [Cyanobacteria bacterium UBA9273]|nr:hypothetical protein [Cyanobacteria bacterium UBA9273]
MFSTHWGIGNGEWGVGSGEWGSWGSGENFCGGLFLHSWSRRFLSLLFGCFPIPYSPFPIPYSPFPIPLIKE